MINSPIDGGGFPPCSFPPRQLSPRPGVARSCKIKPRSCSVLQGAAPAPAGLASPRPADGSPGHRQAVTRLPPRCKSGNDRWRDVAKMPVGITQGKRDEKVKESAMLASVRGDAHRGGSVHGRKRRVGEKISGHQNASAKTACNPRKAQGKRVFIAGLYTGKRCC